MYFTLSITIALLVLDFFTKLLALRILSDQPLVLIPDFLTLSATKNTGIAFGIGIPNVVMVMLIPLILTLLACYFFRSIDMRRRLAHWILALFLAGGVGNFSNRLIEGAVVDFISFSFWPSFNLADAYLTVAAFLMVIFYGKITLKHG